VLLHKCLPARSFHTQIFMNILFYFQSRLKPGRMLLVDTEEKQIIQDVELKLKIARSRPHSLWLKKQVYLLLKILLLFNVYL
jgi:hypothetical protein